MKIKKLYLALIFLQTHFLTLMGVYELGYSSSTSLIDNQTDDQLLMVKKACTGNRGLCFWETIKREKVETEMEMEMDSEINRRVLMMQKKFISYETLKKDVIPCGRPGASYYNCQVTGEANPYNRGCEVITRCDRKAGGHM
ncbi:Rapid ALkalinization Factor [Macleaya cordata]|uniref:Rapid ALkalinization Factor n=1 Tax=Macleaya cordata TaxID=56857 RepID=A0A200Q5C2_MACCD|nr:Rapid ALkalinization Factor [Macleaya cordata]